MPYFSVIIPVFNKEAFVAKTIESVLAQTYTDYEIILINDGSTDSSENIIKMFTDSRIQYFAKLNEGVAIARNFGLEKAQGEYICFLDADDYWHPAFLDTLHQYCQKFPEHKVFATAIEMETRDKKVAAQYSIPKNSDCEIVDFFEASQQECVLWTSSIAIHKSVLTTVGAFDPNIKKGEDTELWIRIGLHYPIVFIWKILAKYVYDPNSISRNLDYFFEPYVFEKYKTEETKNQKLKKYLDLNRFSAVIKCKLKGDTETATHLYGQIDLKNLSLNRRIALQLPSFVLKFLIKMKNTLA